jgi:hypothetical protein
MNNGIRWYGCIVSVNGERNADIVLNMKMKERCLNRRLENKIETAG